jgi:hypothetical protein
LKQTACGPYKPGGYCVGSALVDGAGTGANFLTLAARACAWEKLAEKNLLNPDLTVDRYRLFNNMLSSQPMCMNLFADLRLAVQHGNANAGEIVRAMFRELPIATVDGLEIEMLPQPKKNYIDDKTAFDAAVFFTDRDGHKGLASIETKYTDKLGGNAAVNEKFQKDKARELGLFNDEGSAWYETHHLDQIVRNLLLTVVYGERHQLRLVRNFVIAPVADQETPKLIDTLRPRLAARYRDAISLVPLEEVVDRGLGAADGPFKGHLREFRRRYLEFGPVEHFLSAS